jgi:hypothetical protein
MDEPFGHGLVRHVEIDHRWQRFAAGHVVHDRGTSAGL